MATITDLAPIPYKTKLLDSNGLLTVPWQAWFRQIFLRVGSNQASLLVNPMAALGDLIYGGALGSPLRLAGDTSNIRKFLRSFGASGSATSPVWDTLLSSDIPALNYVTSIAMTVPGILSVSGSPISSNGTLALSLTNQSANTLFAGPASGGAAAPTFRLLATADFVAPTIQKFTAAPTGATNYAFTVSSANATVGATYTNNGQTFTVLQTIASATLLFMSGTGTPSASGTLTKASGTGDATITFSAFNGCYVLPTSPRAPISILVEGVAGGGGGGGAATTGVSPNTSAGGGGSGGGYFRKLITSPSSFYAYAVGLGGAVTAGANGSAGGNTTFGTSLLTANGGTGGTLGNASGGVTFGGAGASGPSASGGDINISGGPGGTAIYQGTNSVSLSGSGGISQLGKGAIAQANAGAGVAGSNYGSGGGGASNGVSTTQTAGGQGAPGVLIIEELYQ